MLILKGSYFIFNILYKIRAFKNEQPIFSPKKIYEPFRIKRLIYIISNKKLLNFKTWFK
jgi:hypothetical protein